MRWRHKSLVSCAALLSACACLFAFSGQAAATDVCSAGTGLPPFLGSGADPNLLLAIDNSGSMLDLAYIDQDTQCFDDGYLVNKSGVADTTIQYAGNYEPNQWYHWVNDVPFWKSGKGYSAGDIVQENQIYYQATKSGTSGGVTIETDTGVTWKVLYQVDPWRNNTAYPEHSYVRYEKQLYYTPSGGTSKDSNPTDGLNPEGDSVVTWVAVDSTWRNGADYEIGDIVSHRGMLYKATKDGTASDSDPTDGLSLHGDKGVTWVLLDTSSFQAVTEEDAKDACGDADGSKYSHSDLCVTVASKTVGTVTTPYLVTAFAAKGNFLNWATASKFDIQKSILTGGKYDAAETYDEDNDFLVSENRGCAGRRFIKQLTMQDGSKLTLAVGGPSEEGRIDTTDDTSRIAILGVRTNGFDVSACQDAVDEMASEKPSLGNLKGYVDECLGYKTNPNILTTSHASFNHSLQFCWYLQKHGDYQPGEGDTQSFQNDCVKIYANIPPSTINPWDSSYVCSGLYDSGLEDTKREGYIGRCWEPASIPDGCKKVTCTDPDGDGNPDNDTDILSQATAKPFREPVCSRDNYVYYCSGSFNKNTGACGGSPGVWKPKLADANSEDGTVCNPAGPVIEALWTNDNNPNDADDCVIEAAKDYCGYLQVPEVIDPSDQVSETGEFWNMPAVLIDSGVVAQLGTDRPLATLKGLLQFEPPAEPATDKPAPPDGPRGLLYDVAGDLRLGVMVLNDNGAKTECAAATTDSTMVKYCPKTNRDGARVVAQIQAGMTSTSEPDPASPGNFIVKENWEHYKKLVAAINNARGTAWTPLAEAMYTALSYYSQNKVPRLDAATPPLDFNLPGEGTSDDPWPDPVQYWCQDNHVLVITEGASTADINPTVAAFAQAHGESSEVAEDVCKVGDKPSPLHASPYLDNLTYFGQNATVEGAAANSSTLYTQLIATNKEPPDAAFAKQPVTTHIVTTGSLRTDGTGECSPKTLMTNAATNGGSTLLTGEDPTLLEANLKAVLSGILGRASAGSAASVISSSRSGEGAVYQAVFWPKVDRALGKDPLTWIGDVHGLFIDDQGRMWDDNDGNGELWSEDANGNGRLDKKEDIDPDGDGPGEGNNCLSGDRRVFFYSDGVETKICFNDSAWTSDPPVCDTSLTNYCDKAGEPFPIKSFNKYLWSANQVLQGIDTAHLASNRSVSSATDNRWIWGTSPERYIFTWNDLDNDGIVDSDGKGGANDEVIPLESSVDWAAKSSTHHSIFHDFKVADATEMNHFVDWLRGGDLYEADLDEVGVLDPEEDINGNGVRDDVYRCRRADCDAPSSSTNPEWRLGDVVHSTPKLVAQPAEAFHTIYRDPSYAWFVKRHRYRRNVVYFGANDGMLHAVNGGFYNEKENKFHKNLTLTDGVASFDDSDPAPALGMELWAYVPYNLQPHLQCLAKPLYGAGDGTGHKYFVDKEPRIFDMQIFEEEAACSTDPYAQDCIHPKGWGTVLVGSMRFGGAPITAKDGPQWSASDTRQFISSYFLLDITDPERPPKLLGEMTRTIEKDPTDATRDKYANLGFSTPMPAAVVMRGDDGATTWYLVLGNGPNSLEGTNDQQGKVAVLPLKLDPETGVLATGARILNKKPLSATDSGVLAVVDDTTDTTTRFVSDMMTVDFDLEAQTDPVYGALYKSDAVYFGTVDGSGFVGDKWAGGGGVYRLVARKIASGVQQPTTPLDWQIKKLIDTQAPVTGALSVGWDEANYWLYFGTGRFYATDDKKDDTVQRFFGVKEPLNTSCEMTWNEIVWSGTSLDPAAAAGSRGLVRTDNIQVVESKSFMLEDQPVVFCPNDSATDITATNYCNLGFLDTPLKAIGGISYYSYEKLRQYIAGEPRDSASSCPQDDPAIGVDGWYRVLQEPRERVTGQSALLGGLVTFTTYQPNADDCTPEGMSNLYGVHYQTGTAWYENVFGLSTRDGRTIVLDKLSLGVGLATTPSMHSGGEGSDAKAFIQSSTGEIIEIKRENLPIKPPKSGKMRCCYDCE